MERIVIVAYKPLAGQKERLAQLMKNHLPVLRREGLASDRESIIVEARDGTFVEVFGWKSKEAMEAAHQNPQVQKMWEEFAAVCEYVPVGSLEESAEIFSEFAPFPAS